MPDPISQTTAEFGRRVRQYRAKAKLSQEHLAERAGVHWTFVGQTERGMRNLSLHNITKLAAGLGVDPGVLVKGLKPPR